ncbi:TPA_exp: putative endochitinase [Trichophyton benhamiae CBS 112371]|uniref:Probable endochitinase ARB_07371 n=1 Tax=Arthroderma benhamiae (strain ATCC MYA-4681 / CBS 112371) TaxID=663331 RepID=CHI1_ARTBC|nr:class III chitinase ChiA1 [Trichophyton benhamiae CBS 112371]D4AT07.1 RecName: Full=Probable endochitinase ARB_07371; Flags: Precursor [Trichophyton benhamiae CBS 112371]EFE33907.1 class III chitinase ChiA1 [Trichophyton benhamiae CBS 112371]DAA76900.1 TPA_exp: putative endochitinase [Trichophyton benhamiae CBS 112371]
MALPKTIMAFIAFISFLVSTTFAVDVFSTTNVVTYWGQGHDQKRLSHYCQQAEHDIIVIGFVNVFPDQGKGGWPGTNFGNQCFMGTYITPEGEETELLSSCHKIIEDIPICKAAGKTIMLSLGGQAVDGSKTYSVKTRQSAVYFADFLWRAFGPVSPEWDGPRPFGDNVIDGFDFDIEANGGANYEYMVERLRSNFATDSSRQYYLSAAPQCVLPDGNLGNVISSSAFDFIFVQFYNTPSCSAFNWAQNPSKSGFTFDSWVQFIRKGASRNAKLFIGLVGDHTRVSPHGEYTKDDSNYLALPDADKLIKAYMNKYRANFGGVMIWDALTSDENKLVTGTYSSNIKRLLLNNDPSRPTTTSKTMSSTKTSMSTTTSKYTVTTSTISSTSKISSSTWSMPTMTTSTRTTSSTATRSSTIVTPSTSPNPTTSTSTTSGHQNTTATTTEIETQTSKTFITTTSIWSSGTGIGTCTGIPTITTTPRYPNATFTSDTTGSPTMSDTTITLSVTSSMHQISDTTTTIPTFSTTPIQTSDISLSMPSGTTTSKHQSSGITIPGPPHMSTTIVPASPTKPGHSTTTAIVTTTFTSVCPTGITTVTTTYTTIYCPEATPMPTAGNPPPPPGMEWTTIVTTCTKCASTSAIMTVTYPVTVPSEPMTPTQVPGTLPPPGAPGTGSGIPPPKTPSNEPGSPGTLTGIFPPKPTMSVPPEMGGNGGDRTPVYTGGAGVVSPSFSVVVIVLGSIVYHIMQ